VLPWLHGHRPSGLSSVPRPVRAPLWAAFRPHQGLQSPRKWIGEPSRALGPLAHRHHAPQGYATSPRRQVRNRQPLDISPPPEPGDAHVSPPRHDTAYPRHGSGSLPDPARPLGPKRPPRAALRSPGAPGAKEGPYALHSHPKRTPIALLPAPRPAPRCFPQLPIFPIIGRLPDPENRHSGIYSTDIDTRGPKASFFDQMRATFDKFLQISTKRRTF
jgi:hypothetical protein